MDKERWDLQVNLILSTSMNMYSHIAPMAKEGAKANTPTWIFWSITRSQACTIRVRHQTGSLAYISTALEWLRIEKGLIVVGWISEPTSLIAYWTIDLDIEISYSVWILQHFLHQIFCAFHFLQLWGGVQEGQRVNGGRLHIGAKYLNRRFN